MKENNDERLLKTLEYIKIHCKAHGDCSSCSLQFKDTKRCQVAALAREMLSAPAFWDLEKLEEIIYA